MEKQAEILLIVCICAVQTNPSMIHQMFAYRWFASVWGGCKETSSAKVHILPKELQKN